VLTRPDRVEAFIDEFQRRYRVLLEISGSRLKTMRSRLRASASISRQRWPLS
jgi:hypothetical protein